MAEEIALETILSNRVYLAAFSNFCASECSDENLLFIQAVDRFHEDVTEPSVRKETAVKLSELYVKEGSLLEINLPSEIIAKLLVELESVEIKASIFDDAREAIFKLMSRDTYERFLVSEEYAITLRVDSEALERKSLREFHSSRRRDSIRTSSLLLRSFSIASRTHGEIGKVKKASKNSQNMFAMMFYEELFKISPEAHLLFNNSISHQGTMLSNVLQQLLALMQNNDQKFDHVVARLAGIHVHMGITSSMFRSFGKALTNTLRIQLQLEEKSCEWLLVQRHWDAAYNKISSALVGAMLAMPEQSGGLFSRNKAKVPRWLGGQLKEYNKYTMATIQRIKQTGKVDLFTEIFYSNFFLVSPESVDKFPHVAQQGQALWGALDTVVRMLSTPRKMHNILNTLAKSHAEKGISPREFDFFTVTIRKTFKDVLKSEYTDAMDSIWKQFLELLTLFMGHASTRTDSVARDTTLTPTDGGYTQGLVDMFAELPTSQTESERENSNSETSQSMTVTPLTFSLLRTLMPSMVKDRAVLEEVNKLHDQLIYTVDQLKTYSLEALEKHVCSATARALTPYLQPPALAGGVSPGFTLKSPPFGRNTSGRASPNSSA